jgi:hypothetical protein
MLRLKRESMRRSVPGMSRFWAELRSVDVDVEIRDHD